MKARHILLFSAVSLLGLSQAALLHSQPYIDSWSTVCDTTSTGDGANSWGGHQCSIVRNSAGAIYTVYTVAGPSELKRAFRVVRKTEDGWETVAQGPSGREPAQILIGPDDRLYVVCWPDGHPKLWESDTDGNNFAASDIPGNWDPGNNWPYFSTGIDEVGTLYVLASGGGRPGYFKLAYRSPGAGAWSDVKKIDIDYRYCYTYMAPQAGHELHLASLRDVTWDELGYTQPAGAFDYCFNAVKSWYSPGLTSRELTETLIREEKPTGQYPNPNISFNYNGDFYVDQRGRSHILCPVSGAGTGGMARLVHYILDGTATVASVELPAAIKNGRLIQNEKGKFFLITFKNGSLVVYPASDANGVQLEAPTTISLAGHTVLYSNLHLAAPRCGVPLSDEVDIIFPSGTSAEAWVYFKLHLPEGAPADSTLLPVQDIRVYPNPVGGALFISGLEGHAKITLYGVWGNIVFYRENNAGYIDIANLPAGVYILQAEASSGVITRKIVKR